MALHLFPYYSDMMGMCNNGRKCIKTSEENPDRASSSRQCTQQRSKGSVFHAMAEYNASNLRMESINQPKWPGGTTSRSLLYS